MNTNRQQEGGSPILTQEYLKECVTQDTSTQELTWRTRPFSHFNDDSTWMAFNTNWAGRKVKKNLILNGNKFSSKDILRLYEKGQGCEAIGNYKKRYVKLRSDSKSGYSGVTWQESNKMWVVQIGNLGTQLNLGRYKNLDEALELGKKPKISMDMFENYQRQAKPLGNFHLEKTSCARP